MQRVNVIRFSCFMEPSLAIWASDKFRVHAYQDGDAIRLDIERKDGLDGITWDELQAIKNDCGFSDKDAVEFYPAQDDVINSGNWRHLYVFNNRLPLIQRLPAASGHSNHAVRVPLRTALEAELFA